MAFKIRGTPIKNPSDFKIERFKVTDIDRLANAKAVGDLIAKKLKFYFTYEAITGYELDHILYEIWEAPGIFFRLDYDYNGVQKDAMVYVGSIPSELHKAGKTSNWTWKNVTFNLIEQ